jgi:hypothetical protein
MNCYVGGAGEFRGRSESRVVPQAAAEFESPGSSTYPNGHILAEMEKIKIEQHSFTGILWVGAWLFTIGFLHLTFWKGVLAIVLWPYYLGVTFSSLLK